MYRKHNKIDNWVRKTVGHVQQLGLIFFARSLHNENVVLSKSNRHKKHTKDNSHFRSLSFFVVNIINVIKFYSLWELMRVGKVLLKMNRA